MTWERFGYICRKASVDCEGQEPISTCLSRIESEKSCKFYGEKIENNGLPRKILKQIGNIGNRYEAQRALEIYKGLNLAKHFEEPMRFKRVVAYLSYVTFIFYTVVAIYQLKVSPSFLKAFENFGLSMPVNLKFYQDYFLYFVLVVSIFMIAALFIGFQLKKLFSFSLGIENSPVIKFMVFPNIRKSYLRVIDILQFPVLFSSQFDNQDESPLSSHLQVIESSKMCVSTEIQKLIEIEMRSLLESCEKQMRYISVAVSLVIVAAIFFFLISAYSPIFILGETI